MVLWVHARSPKIEHRIFKISITTSARIPSNLSSPLKQHISIEVFVVYVDTGSPVLYIPSKSRDLADENNKFLNFYNFFISKPILVLLIVLET
jgi:hypothetical protein